MNDAAVFGILITIFVFITIVSVIIELKSSKHIEKVDTKIEDENIKIDFGPDLDLNFNHKNK